MYKKIAVVYHNSPEAWRALSAALPLAKGFGAELEIILTMGRRPLYSAYAQAVSPEAGEMLAHDREAFYREFQERARKQAITFGLIPAFHVFESDEQTEILELLRREGADLLIIGLHCRGLWISRLWRAVYELAENAPCSILGVH